MNIFKYLTLIAVLLCTAGTIEARRAILVTHYGSSDERTRALTIDRITADIAQSFPDYEVRQAYISPVVLRSMERKGLKMDSPLEAILKLRAEGYDSVYVQPTTLLDGAETSEVKRVCDSTAAFFKLLKCGEALCYSPDDCLQLTEILAREPVEAGEAVVYAGHGNMLPSTATYSQLDYMLSAAGHTAYHVSTIEGYPTASSTITRLKQSNPTVKHVKIIPLLLVCGNHTKVDIAGEFADTLKAAGYGTEVVFRGLAEVPAVRNLYVERVKALVE